MEALHDIVKSGKTRYIGASSMFAWQLVKAQETAKKNGWTKFISMQNHLNLIYREEEREMIPLCISDDLAITPCTPVSYQGINSPKLIGFILTNTFPLPSKDSHLVTKGIILKSPTSFLYISLRSIIS